MPDEYLLVELWESKNKAWERLPRQERKDILDQIGAGVGALVQEGLQPLGFFVNDHQDVPGRHREHWQFVAVWKLPSKALLEKMLPQVDTLPRWFDVMNEKRVWGRILDPVKEGTEVLLSWGDKDKPPSTLTGRFGDLEQKVAELLALLKHNPEALQEKHADRIERLEQGVAQVKAMLNDLRKRHRKPECGPDWRVFCCLFAA